MLYILLILLIFGFFSIRKFAMKYDDDEFLMLLIADVLSLFVIVVVIFCMLGKYYMIKTTAEPQIQVLEEQNDTVLRQLEPLVEKYLKYESNSLKELKQNPQMLITLSVFPELKGNQFVQSQIDTVQKNQQAITKLKLQKAKLNSYRIWLFVGE